MTELSQLLRIVSTIACGVVLIAFSMWATDEARSASQAQAHAAAADGPVAPPAAADHDGVRGAIEDANEQLLEPFDNVIESSNEWAQHAVPALLALLTYGVLARLLAAYLLART